MGIIFSLLLLCNSIVFGVTTKHRSTSLNKITYIKPTSINDWLELSDGNDASEYELDSLYKNSIDFLFFDYFSKFGDGWELVNAYYKGPLYLDRIQLSQSPFKEEYLPVTKVFLIKKKIGPNEVKLALVLNFNNLRIKFNSSKKGALDGAKIFYETVKSVHNNNHLYIGGALEYSSSQYNSPYVRFLPQVENINFTWQDYILDPKTKFDLQQTIDSFLNSYDYESWKRLGLPMSRGLLLYGPPGTGKSFLSKVLVSNILRKRYKNKVTYIHVQARHIHSLNDIRGVFEAARNISPCILFFEDIDLIAGTDRFNRPQIKNELMQQLSGLESLNGVMTIGTTNYFERIDPALTRAKRLGYHFNIGLPSLIERGYLIANFTSKLILQGEGLVSYIASKTEGFSGADLKELIDLASEDAINDKQYRTGNYLMPKLKISLTQKHFDKALDFKLKNHKIKMH